jgi:hypothetical protein
MNLRAATATTLAISDDLSRTELTAQSQENATLGCSRARVLAGFEAWWPFLNLSAAHFAVEGLSRVAKLSNFEQTASANKQMLTPGKLKRLVG